MTITKKMAALACAGFALAITAAAQKLPPAEEGRRVYLANNCYGCHGDIAGGSSYGAPAFRGDEGVELGDLTEAVQQGEDRGMPAFPNISSTDINNLYAYFQSIGTSSEPMFYLWWEPVPTAGLWLRPPRLYASLRPKRLRTTSR